ncbi:MAG TPA: amino acid adenylation domain-containing protein, partial [Longimicrobium sp.]|nr:amino acid adenylation domain-containing protein [Longimicrobium sp.]
TFRALVAGEAESVLTAFEHQSLPFDRLVEELRLPRDPGRNPVFQAVMTLQNARMELLELPGCAVTQLRPRSEAARFDLTFDTYEEGDGSLRLEVNWATDLFDASTVRRLSGHYLRLLETASAAPGVRRSELEMDDAAERAFVIEACNRTASEYERDVPVHRLFEARAAETPNAIAVETADLRLTYAELNARANRLARRIAAAGAGAEARVGVAMERSADLVVALLAVLKAGAAYVPLDAQYPAERLAYMVADAGVSVLVVIDEVPSTLASFGGAVIRTSEKDEEWDDGNLAVETDPDGLAYAVYTSGSTGKPKGVACPHRGVVRLVRGADYAPFARDEVFLLLAPVAFDASTFEIWGPLLNGARLAVAPPHQLSLRDIGRTIEERGVTTLWLTAGLLPGMVDEEVEALGRLRHLVAGGDVISAPHVARVVTAHPGLRVTNGYGPTENTTFTTCHDVRPEDVRGPSLALGRPLPESHAAIPIGRPIANTTVYVLDAHWRPCAIGVPGELCTGGDGVVRGYLGRTGLTADRFVPDPFSSVPGARLYRTGDRVRRREDGTLEFLGRMDQQV